MLKWCWSQLSSSRSVGIPPKRFPTAWSLDLSALVRIMARWEFDKTFWAMLIHSMWWWRRVVQSVWKYLERSKFHYILGQSEGEGHRYCKQWCNEFGYAATCPAQTVFLSSCTVILCFLTFSSGKRTINASFIPYWFRFILYVSVFYALLNQVSIFIKWTRMAAAFVMHRTPFNPDPNKVIAMMIN